MKRTSPHHARRLLLLPLTLAATVAGCASATDDDGTEPTPSATSDAVDTADTADAAVAPVESADGYLHVPGGFEVHKSCIVHLDDGDSAHDETIYKANGEVKHLPPCAHARRGGHARPDHAASAAPEGSPVPAVNGWVDSVWAYQPNGVGEFWGAWTVPQNPGFSAGQTIFFFNSSESTEVNILQPVLQWGPSAAGGGNYWGIASWNVGPGYTIVSSLRRTSSGHYIRGLSKRSIHYCPWVFGYCELWDIQALDVTTGVSSTLTTAAPTQVWVQGAVLEAYDVMWTCAQFPGTSLTFANTAVLDQGYNRVWYPPWGPSVSYPKPACGYGATVNSPSSFTLHF